MDTTLITKEKDNNSFGYYLLKAYPQLLGEVELLIEENPEWLSILSEPLQDSEISLGAIEFLGKYFLKEEKPHEVYAELQGIKAGKKKRIIIPASEIEEKDIDWLAKDVLAKGQVHLLVGDPQASKSVFTTDLCARVSTGASIFNETKAEPRNVLIFSAEDDIERVVKPRLRQAKANMNKVFVLDSSEFPELPDDLNQFAKAMAICKPSVMIVDTINAFMGSKVETNSDKSVRSAMKLLKPLAEMYQCAIILVSHLNKSKNSNPLYRVLGSIGYVGLARNVWYIARNEDTGERILSVIKNNNGRLTNWKYKLDVIDDYPVVRFLGSTDELAQDLGSDDDKTVVNECVEDLLQRLEDEGENEIKALKIYLEAEYSPSAIKRAIKFVTSEKLVNRKQVGKKHYISVRPLNTEPLADNELDKGGE